MKRISHDKRLNHVAALAAQGSNSLCRSLVGRIIQPQRKQNPYKPRYATMRVAKVSEILKPKPNSEYSLYRTWTLRGSWMQRDEKELLGTWEILAGASGGTHEQRKRGINNPVVVRARMSERLVVPLRLGNSRGGKGPWLTTCRLRQIRELIGTNIRIL